MPATSSTLRPIPVGSGGGSRGSRCSRRSRCWRSGRCRGSRTCAIGSGRPSRGGWRPPPACSLLSMFGFVRTLWAAFERLLPWRRAVILGFAEQAANVLLPVGGVGGPALGALVMRRAGVPAWFADERHAVLFLSTSFVGFVALLFAGLGLALGVLPGDVSLAAALIPAVVSALILAGATAFALSETPPASVRGRFWSAPVEGARVRPQRRARDRRAAPARRPAPDRRRGHLLRGRRRRARLQLPGLRRRRPAARRLHPRLHARATPARCCRRRAASAAPRAA